MRRLAIIPARAGSKRIPGKNIRNFAGRPMIHHVLRAAQESKLFDTIHVSTDSPQIVEIVKKLGLGVEFMRPASLADDQTPIMPVLKYVIEEHHRRGFEYEQAWMLMACAPLLDAETLQQAEKVFAAAGGGQPLLAVSEYPSPIEWALSRAPNGQMTPLQPGMFAVPSQTIEKKYFDAGCFAIFPPAVVQNSQGAGSDKGFLGYVLPKSMSVDIDDEQDWELAEAIFQSKKKKV
jgi:N-acylneuraminate cytidylyltransferase